MKNKEEIKEILDYLQTTEEKTLNFDSEAIAAAYQKNDGAQSLAIKILSVFGGILASFAFVGFIFLARLEDSEIGMLVMGCVFLVSAVFINKKSNKIIFDTVSVSFFIIGFILIGFSLYEFRIDSNIICILFAVIACVSMIVAQNYILSFVSILIINGSILTLILSNKNYDLIHIYVSVFALILTYFYLKEAKIITSNKILSKLYSPIKTGLAFSFIMGFSFLGIKNGVFPMSPDYIWLSSAIIILTIIYLLYTLFEVLKITKMQHKIAIYIFAALTLLPTIFSPAISGAILLILLCFLVNYKTGFILGIISFIYFISQYYYDLNFTLLTKSILLFSSGVLFIILYLFTHKKITANEKI